MIGRRSAHGFSLVEMIAALVIFSIGVLALMEVFARCLRSTSTTIGYANAVCLAQEQVEETITEGSFIEQTDSGDFAPSFPRHAWTREITETEQLGLYELEVVVSWDERGRERKYVLTTLVAERE